MSSDEIVTLDSEAETATFAQRLAREVMGGLTIGLVGALGAGKTTLSRYLVGALGSPVAVSSPTYVLSHEYSTPSGLVIEHWDLYRLTQLPEELYEPPADTTVRIVEWCDKFPEFLPLVAIKVEISAKEDGKRLLTIVRS